VYGLTLCLGTEVLRQISSRHFSVIQVSLAGSASLAVTVFSAALFLGERVTPAVLLSVLLILAGVLQRFLPRPQLSGS
jgi:drug/metabolite transporter (DMT)-like permease